MAMVPLRVLELESGPAAAYCARLLSALGAHVTKASLDGRPTDPDAVALDAGKHVVRPDTDGAAFPALLAETDVLLCAGDTTEIEQPPFDLRRHRQAHPRLITAAVTPFGESGLHALWRGCDLIAQSAGGLGYGTPPRVVDPEHEYPLQLPGDGISLLCGVVMAMGVLHAAFERDGDGLGRHVEVSAQEVVASLMFANVGALLAEGRPPGRLASERPNARRSLLRCADGYLATMTARPRHLRAWLGLMGEAGATLIARLDAGQTGASMQNAVDEAAQEWVAGRTRREVTDTAQAVHVPVEPVMAPSELLRDPHLAARGFWLDAATAPATFIPSTGLGPIAPDDGVRALPDVIPSQWREAAGPWRPPATALPLAGVRVVDLGWVFAAPIATRVLAALGADVIKVQGPHAADEGRNREFTYRAVNAGKRSIGLDAKSEEGVRSLRALLRDADVVVENFSTGVMERLGIGWEDLHRLNPRLIMLSVSGMGRTGPYGHHVMFGQLAQAFSGLTALTGYKGGPPRGIEDGGFWSDPVTGYSAALAVLGALRERAQTGLGRRIDISLTEATAALFVRPFTAAQRGDELVPADNIHPAMAPHDVYRAGPLDGDYWVAVAVRDDAQWRACCNVIGRPDCVQDARFADATARGLNRAALRDVIETWTAQHSAAQAAGILQEAGIAAFPSYSTADVVVDGHLRERGFFVTEGAVAEAAAQTVMMALPWRLRPAGAVSYGRAPARDQHRDEILEGLKV